jgi:hypothetical protein
MNNTLAETMIKKGNYRIDVFAPDRMTFIVVDSNEGFWTAFNSLGVSVLRAKAKQDIKQTLSNASQDDLNLYHNQATI